MKRTRRAAWWCGLLAVAALAAPAAAWDVYANSQDGNPIPDVNKPDRDGDGFWPDANDNSCWQVAAANLLAAGGWGIGAPQQDAQSRADHIYTTMTNVQGFNACGNAGQEMKWWLQNYGQNAASGDYDANNPYTNVNITQTQNALAQQDYNNLLNGLAANPAQYVTVLWNLEPNFHFLTLVGGNHDNAQPPANNTLSVWHDSDRVCGGAADNSYTNSFAGGSWSLSYFPDHAINSKEYDLLTQGLHLVATAYWINHHIPGDPASDLLGGSQGGSLGAPAFPTDHVLRVPNEFHPNVPKEISLLVDYAGSANLTVEGQIYLLDDQGRHWNPTLTLAPDGSQILFEWLLPYSPAEEYIVFPDDKYNYLTLDLANGKDVLGWDLAFVPEPATLSVLALGGLALSRRRR